MRDDRAAQADSEFGETWPGEIDVTADHLVIDSGQACEDAGALA